MVYDVTRPEQDYRLANKGKIVHSFDVNFKSKIQISIQTMELDKNL